MDYDKIFISAAVVIIAVIAFFGTNGIITFYNDQYDKNVGADSNVSQGINSIQNNLRSSFETIGEDVGTATEGQEGGGSSDTDTNLATRGLNIISAIKGMLGLFPALLNDANTATGGFAYDYISIAQTVFIILFGLAFAYLLFLGIKR